MKELTKYEDIAVKDNYKECEYLWGGCDFIVTDDDIELLKQGKIFNFTVNGEYGCTLAMAKTVRKDKEKTI